MDGDDISLPNRFTKEVEFLDGHPDVAIVSSTIIFTCIGAITMSAIAGIYNINQEPVSREYANSMMQTLEKYPADQVQVWQQDHIFLGCHAQWITPEAPFEQLPFYDDRRQMAITADAIIDNRDELFHRLQISHEERKLIPDSQLILLAYSKWGEATPEHLVGDFSFMIWDRNKQKLFGARDYSGARTLYYYKDDQRAAFCTVMAPLLSLPFVERDLNEQWLADYLAIPDMFDTVDPASTVYKHIAQIPPSHTISISGDRVNLSRYCQLTVENTLNFKSNVAYEEAFKEVFGNAVNDYMRTDHKVGSRLSGGLDSGSVVGFAAKALVEHTRSSFQFDYLTSSHHFCYTGIRRKHFHFVGWMVCLSIYQGVKKIYCITGKTASAPNIG